MLEWIHAARGDHRGALCAGAVARRAPRSGSAHPHRRRAAHQQFPPLAARLRRALLQRAPVAGFRGRGLARRSVFLCGPRAALRTAPRGAERRAVSEALRKRVLTPVVLPAALLAILLWMPAWVMVVALTVVLLAGAWEWSAFLRLSTAGRRLIYVALVALLLPLAWRVS